MTPAPAAVMRVLAIQRVYCFYTEVIAEEAQNRFAVAPVYPQTEAAVGAELPGHGDELVRDSGADEDLLGAQGTLHRLKEHYSERAIVTV